MEDRVLLASFLVTSNVDDGVSSNTLRSAIIGLNSSSDPTNTIDFAIGAVGSAQTITLSSDLPAITKSVVINGLTQGGTVNSSASGSNASLRIQINANSHAALAFGPGSASSTAENLSIVNSSGAAIAVNANNITVAGNFLGLAADGLTPAGNASGVSIAAGVTGSVIGTTSLATRNLIATNATGVDGAGTATIQNNLFGTDKTGVTSVPNAVGLRISGSNNVIGGTATNAGNTIANSTVTGIVVDTGTQNRISQNSIYANANAISLTNGGNANQVSTTTLKVTSVGALTNVQGTFNATTTGSFTIELFSSVATDPGTPGQAHTFIGSITQNVLTTGAQTFNGVFAVAIPAGQLVTASVTSPANNTSGFSSTSSGLADPYVVTTTADSGFGSLRSAILAANQAVDTNTITFTIPTTDAGYDPSSKTWTISPSSVLPSITNPVLIDGTTSLAYNGVPLIDIDGSSLTTGSPVGFTLSGTSNGSRIRGLAIYHFATAGIELISGSNSIQSNYLGIDSEETQGIGNGTGVLVQSSNNTIGGFSGLGNLISGNIGDGVVLTGLSATGNTISGNKIGTNFVGDAALANGGNGVRITGTGAPNSNNTVGGSTTNLANTIAFNAAGSAVYVDASVGNTISRNVIVRNLLGITLVNGANANAPTPLLSSITPVAGSTQVVGSLTGGTPNTTYTLEFFASGSGDPITGVQARTFLDSASVTTDATGKVDFTVTLAATVAPGQTVIATSTSNSSRSTSAFSTGSGLAGSTLVVTTTADSGDGSLRNAILLANAAGGSSTILFAIPESGPNFDPVNGWTIPVGTTALPAITKTVVIDASSLAAADGTPRITIDGTSSSAGSIGLVLASGSAGSTISGIAVTHFGGSAIQVASANNNTLVGDSIKANLGVGVEIVSGSGNVISKTIVSANGMVNGPSNGIVLGAAVTNKQATPNALNFTSVANRTEIEGTFAPPTPGDYTFEFYVGAAGSGNAVNADQYLGSTVLTFSASSSPNFSFALSTATPLAAGSHIYATVTSAARGTSVFAQSGDAASPFVVSTNADSKIGSLREAILNVNAVASATSTDITFGIGGVSKTIALQSALPAITAPVHINGTTQTGVVIDGQNLLGSGLTLTAGSDGSKIEALTIQRFAGAAISISSNNDIVINNQINASTYGVLINSDPINTVGGSHNIVGGDSASDANTFTNNNSAAIFVQMGADNQFLSNTFVQNGTSGSLAIDYGFNVTAPNAPVIQSVTKVGSTFLVTFSVTGLEGTSTKIQAYNNSANGTKQALTLVGSPPATSGIVNFPSVTPGGPHTVTQTFSITVNDSITDPVESIVLTSTLTSDLVGTSRLSNTAAPTTDFVVTNNQDSGQGSLRQAIADAKASGTTDAKIVFNIGQGSIGFNPSDPYEIDLYSPLIIDSKVEIDGFSQSDYLNIQNQTALPRRQLVTIDGSLIADSTYSSQGVMVLTANSISSQIEGLIFTSTPSTVQTEEGSPPEPSGDLDAAIQIFGNDNLLSGNFIGVNYAEATTRHDASASITPSGFLHGVHVSGGQGNRIGDATSEAVLSVVGKTLDSAIFIDSANGNLVQNFYVGIGVDLQGNSFQSDAVANLGVGVELASSSGNQIGVDSTLGLVVIAGNGLDGVYIRNQSTNNSIQNAFIGTDATGTIAIGNGVSTATGASKNGITISNSSGNVIGGVTAGSRVLVSGNYGDGIFIILGSTSNLIQNAYIGTDINASVALPNAGNGITISGAGTADNRIGSLVDGTRVIDSGNAGNGVALLNLSVGTKIQNTDVGIDATGTKAVANHLDGILIDHSSANLIGIDANDPTGTHRNVISGNTLNGIHITNALSTGNTIANSIIGTAVISLQGQTNRGNQQDGILIEDAVGTTIGTSWRFHDGVLIPSNVISGNQRNGIHLNGSAHATNIQFNFVGTDLAGQVSNTIFANAQNGVLINGNASQNFVGFPLDPQNPAAGPFSNLISGNIGDGILIDGTGATSNTISRNWIGVSADGSQTIANANGVRISNAPGNTIGGASSFASNLIQGNAGFGVVIEGAASRNNVVQGNRIGADSLTSQLPGNTLGGVEILNAGANFIGGGSAALGNLIVGNLNDGILIRYDTTINFGSIGGNLVANNVLSRNVGNGIHLVNLTNRQLPATDRIDANAIGSDPSRTTSFYGGTPLGNRLDGILGESFAALISNNVIVANGVSGIDFIRANRGTGVGNLSGTFVWANKIGLNGASTSAYGVDPLSDNTTTAFPLGNVLDGIRLDDVFGVNIGQMNDGTANGNVISGNLGRGIEVISSVLRSVSLANSNSPNEIKNNRIGTDGLGTSASDGQHLLGNLGDGIFLFNALPTLIINNVISGNRGSGVHAQVNTTSTSSNLLTIANNKIGTNIFGNRVNGLSGGAANSLVIDLLGNSSDGVFIDSANAATSIVGNLVSGNRSNGIDLLQSKNLVVQGNFVGTAANGAPSSDGTDFGNSSNGIFLNQSSGNLIGGTNAQGNTVSGNFASGISLSGVADGTHADNNYVSGNRIGVDATGYIPIPNKFTGLVLNEATYNTIGSATIANGINPPIQYDGNLISANRLLGILLTSDANHNNIYGNKIGVDTDGNARDKLGNTSDGIFLNNVKYTAIGGNGDGQTNVISGNEANGVHIFGRGSTNNTLMNNFIGLNSTGTAAARNQANGVVVDNAGASNVIGGGNRISGNGSSGVLLYSTSGSGGTQVSDNLIGLDTTGTRAIANGASGIFIFGSSDNLIGSTQASDGHDASGGNFISGNSQAGIEIFSPAKDSKADRNFVLGNKIGIDAKTGTQAISNRADGIEIYNGNGNHIGGLGPNERNTISGNLLNGIYIDVFPTRAADDDVVGQNVIDGNWIGTDASGMTAIGTQRNGILINNSPFNFIGKPTSGEDSIAGTNVPNVPRNVIAGNLEAGIQFAGNTSGNYVQGNYLGVRADGVGGENLKNPFGIYVNNLGSFTSSQLIGGSSKGQGNLIAGGATATIANTANSAFAGIFLSGPQDPNFSGSTRIEGNLIGLDKNGNIAGSQIGVLINNSSYNHVGGIASGSGNVISGNVNAGVNILGPLAIGNAILGNRIGTNVDGTNVPITLVPESAHTSRLQQNGVMITNAFGNTIGDASAENTISGNINGILLTGINATLGGPGNTVTNNKIGTDPTGSMAVPNLEVGVYISSSQANVVTSNLISANGISGVNIFGELSSRNVVAGNIIGPDRNLASTFTFARMAPIIVPTSVPGYLIYFGGQRNGISIIGSSNNVIGGDGNSVNLIQGNIDVGLYITARDFTNRIYAAPTNTQLLANQIKQNGIYGLLFFDSPNNTAGPQTKVSGSPINFLNYLTSINGQAPGLTPQSVFLPPVTQTRAASVPSGPQRRIGVRSASIHDLRLTRKLS